MLCPSALFVRAKSIHDYVMLDGPASGDVPAANYGIGPQGKYKRIPCFKLGRKGLWFRYVK